MFFRSPKLGAKSPPMVHDQNAVNLMDNSEVEDINSRQ